MRKIKNKEHIFFYQNSNNKPKKNCYDLQKKTN